MDLARLPGPVAEEWDWQMSAECRGMAVSVFFSPWGERGARRAAREEVAKLICQGCPVIGECREHALTVRENYGVWGGLTEKERDEILHRQTRGMTNDDPAGAAESH